MVKMATKLKGLVSKNKRRFVADGFDLDLSCIFLLWLKEICTRPKLVWNTFCTLFPTPSLYDHPNRMWLGLPDCFAWL